MIQFANETIELLKKALHVIKKNHQGDYPQTATALNNLGSAYRDLGEFETIRQQLSNSSITLKDSNDFKMGQKLQQESLDMFNKLYEGNYPSKAILLNQISEYKFVNEEYKEVIVLLKKALIIQNSIYPASHLDTATTSHRIGRAYYCGKSAISDIWLNETLYHYKKALEIFKNHRIVEIPKDLKENSEIIHRSIIRIKEFLQDKQILNHISNQVKEDALVSPLYEESYIKRRLNLNQNVFEILGVAEIAKMLCFEAIYLGIEQRLDKDPKAAIEFTQRYPELIRIMMQTCPEYFVDDNIKQACIERLKTMELLKDNSVKRHIGLYNQEVPENIVSTELEIEEESSEKEHKQKPRIKEEMPLAECVEEKEIDNQNATQVTTIVATQGSWVNRVQDYRDVGKSSKNERQGYCSIS